MSDIRQIIDQAEYRRISLDQIKPAPYNPRIKLTPDDPEYQNIKRSILNHGMIEPIVFNARTKHAVGGNQRLQIIKDLGVTSAICAVVDMPIDEEMQANMALNRIGNLWDQAKLREIIKLLKDDDYDLERTAFSQDEIDRITQDMASSVDSFFETEEATPPRAKKLRQYKCPYCGEVFEK